MLRNGASPYGSAGQVEHSPDKSHDSRLWGYAGELLVSLAEGISMEWVVGGLLPIPPPNMMLP